MLMKTKYYTIPIFIPQLACPFQCIFCNQKKISGHNETPNEEEIYSIINSHLKTFKRENSIINIGFFGGNFTGIPIELQEKYLSIASEYLVSEKIHGIRLSTRPDYINEEVLELLKRYSVTTIELGAQSLDDDVLRKSRRGHSAEDIILASELIKANGFSLGLQMMIGLPGDTLDKSILTAQKIIELGADNTRIYPTLVINGTKLEQLYHEGKYSPLSMNEAVDWVKEILTIFENQEINVLRIGLHPTQGFLTGDEIVAGPFHTSLKELVLTQIWKELFVHKLNKTGNNILLKVSPEQINFAVGYKSTNRILLEEKFSSVKFVPDTSLKDREFDAIYS